MKIDVELRDYFAGQALAGIVRVDQWIDETRNSEDRNNLSDMCYAFADAMLAARGPAPVPAPAPDAERERCAKVCEAKAKFWRSDLDASDIEGSNRCREIANAIECLAAAIRAGVGE